MKMNIRTGLLLALAMALPAASHAAGDAEAGRKVFAKCVSCHAVGPGAHSAFGPQLNGIVGRRAGSASDYKYSAAMAKSGIVWDEKNLAAFIKSPGDVVSGTKMRFWWFGSDKQIADLVAYLRTVP